MLNAFITGALCAAVVSGIAWVQMRISTFAVFPYLIVGVGALVVLNRRLLRRQRVSPGPYHGVSDMLMQIHSPSPTDFPLRWVLKGLHSALLSCIGGTVGAEGAAIEWSHSIAMALRPRSARWFEQRRRTDSSCALAAGISAVFGAPFAGVLVPLELGMGGRTLLTVIHSLVAFLGMQIAISRLGIPHLDLSGTLNAVNLTTGWSWSILLMLAVCSGIAGAFLLRFIKFSRKGISAVAPRWAGSETAVATGFLLALALIFPASLLPTLEVLQKIFLMQIPGSSAAIFLLAKALAFILLITGFGTIGIFSPVFAIGGLFGFAFHFGVAHLKFFEAFSGMNELAPLLALGGAASFWGAVLGAPVSAGVLIFELTGSVATAFACLCAAWIAYRISRRFSPALPAQELLAKGIRLVEGRSFSILDSISVKDVMVTDFETIHEEESLAGIPAKILSSRYPFLPVVSDQDSYVGLVTIDMVQDRLEQTHLQPAVSDLFEVKDLLYRSGFKSRALKTSDRLSATVGIFHDIPCVPVTGEGGKIEGLLFVHHVRLAYDREVARRSLAAGLESS